MSSINTGADLTGPTVVPPDGSVEQPDFIDTIPPDAPTTLTTCFLKHTPILCENFLYKNIQDIKEGEYIISCFSRKLAKVKEIIRNKVSFDTLPVDNRPIKIPRDFFCSDIPNQDLYISGFHRIIFYSKSKNIKVYKQAFKINGLCENFQNENQVLAVTGEDELVYYHIRLEDPTDGLITCNLSVESYQDDFSNI